jgi:hypothetical protein
MACRQFTAVELKRGEVMGHRHDLHSWNRLGGRKLSASRRSEQEQNA